MFNALMPPNLSTLIGDEKENFGKVVFERHGGCRPRLRHGWRLPHLEENKSGKDLRVPDGRWRRWGDDGVMMETVGR